MDIKPRNLYIKLLENINRKEYLIITGARQSGKTTLLIQLYHDLLSSGKQVTMLNLENPDILFQLDAHPENLFHFIKRPPNPLYVDPDSTDRIFLLIDEVQYLKDPCNFLKYHYDTYQENLKVVCTGSSAFYLDTRFKDSLAGRKRIFRLNNLSYDEYLIFRNEYRLSEELKLIRQQKDYISSSYRELLQYFDEYLIFGGYPAVALEHTTDEKILVLREIQTSFLKRDLLESGIRNQQAFYQLMVLLAGQTGNLVNRNELSRSIGIDNKTLGEYMEVLRRCFHIELIRPFSGNIRNELTRMPKVYFKDTGLRNILLNRMWPLQQRDDKGMLIENYVFNRLSEKYANEEIMFWRTTSGHEVDFVISSITNDKKAFEVKFDANRFNPKSLYKFKESYSGFGTSCIAYNHGNECLPVLKL